MPPEIPGFRWDDARGKYFKIQPGHLAPAGSKYTAEAIKKQDEESEQKRKREAREQWLSGWRRIDRPKLSHRNNYLLYNSLTGHGPRPDLLWAEGISVDSIVVTTFHNCGCTSFLQPDPKCMSEILCLKWSAVHQELLIAATGPTMQDKDGKGLFKRFEDVTSTRSKSRYADAIDSLPVYVNNQGVQIMSIDSSGRVMATTPWGLHLFERGTGFASHRALCSEGSNNPAISLLSRPGMDGEMLIHEPTSLSFSDQSSHFGIQQQPHLLDGEYSEIMTADWLDRNIVMWGRRDGKVGLFDVRARAHLGSLKHPSSAIGVHAVNGSQILVAGLEKQMHMYDLRHGALQQTVQTQVRGIQKTCSQPYVSYPAYRNEANIKTVSAISPRLNVAASGAPDGTVQLFNLSEGNEVKPPRGASNGTLEAGSQVKAMCFVDDVIDTGTRLRGPSLFVGRNHTIDEWTWR